MRYLIYLVCIILAAASCSPKVSKKKTSGSAKPPPPPKQEQADKAEDELDQLLKDAVNEKLSKKEERKREAEAEKRLEEIAKQERERQASESERKKAEEERKKVIQLEEIAIEGKVKKTYDFEDDIIEGELKKPDAQYKSGAVSIGDDKSFLTARGATSLAAGDEKETVELVENPFVSTDLWASASVYPTEKMDSYYQLIDSLEQGKEVSRELQINELLNAFMYEYTIGNEDLTLVAEIHEADWKKGHHLLFVGFKQNYALHDGLINPVLNVEFNPDKVLEYRLLGYEDLATELGDASDRFIGTATSSYSIFEVILKNNIPTTDIAEIEFTATLGEEELIKNMPIEIPRHRSQDFVLCSALAELGLLVRQSRYMGDATINSVLLKLGEVSMNSSQAEYLRETLISFYKED